METIRTMRIETLASTAEDGLRDIARSAIGVGRDISIIGCSPFGIATRDGRWSADALIVLEGDPMRRHAIIAGEDDRITACRTRPAGVFAA